MNAKKFIYVKLNYRKVSFDLFKQLSLLIFGHPWMKEHTWLQIFYMNFGTAVHLNGGLTCS